MFDLKVLSQSGVESALEKIERYRLLNEPADAESICRDVLAIDPENQRVVVHLILSLTDQFDKGFAGRFEAAQEAVGRLSSEYEREYYGGIVCERRAKAVMRKGVPGSGSVAYDWLLRAMESYDRAEAIRPEGNDDAMLRWNTCARIIMDNPMVRPEEAAAAPVELE